jgi:hypothetical protein
MTNYASQPVSGGWYERQVVDNCHFQTDPSWPTWHGMASARVEVDPGNDPLALGENTERAEQLFSQTQSGSDVLESASSGTVYYATSYYFPSTWAATQYSWSTMEAAQPGVNCNSNNGNACNSWSIVMQFHPSDNTTWGFLYAAKATPTSPELYSLSLGKTIPFSDGGAINLGGWTDFVFQMNWTSDTVSVWRRDQGATNFTEVVNNAAFTAPTQPVYLKQGLYRGGDVSGRSDIFWLGPTARGTTFSAVEQAAFGTNAGPTGTGSSGTTAPAPTASLSASPASITSGQPTTLTWSSTNATSCTGTNFTASGTSGSVSVSPSATTNYSLTCSGSGGTSSAATAIVTVTAASNKFTMGEQVTPTATVNVRSSAAGTVLGTQKPGAVGTVIAGPTPAALSGTTYTWWNLNFASGVDGWVADNNLQAYAPVVSTPAPTASLSASPASITSGQPTTLTWSSTNATSCTGTNFTASGTSGSVSVSPSATTNYSLTCSGSGGTSSASAATVTVTTGNTGSSSSSGSGTGFLDTYSSLGATWGFSSHKLNSAYTGNWGTVTRQSDGATMPIGFDSSGTANVSTFNSFCAGTNCYLSTLNDQVAGDNATQSTMSKMPRVIVDTNGVLAVCPQPGSTMTTAYRAAVNTPKVHLFAVAQLNYADNRTYQATLPPFVVTGNVTQGSLTASGLSSETGLSTANDVNSGPKPGVIDSAGFLPAGSYLSALPSASTATLGFSAWPLSPTGTKAADTLTFTNAVLPGAWIVNGPASSSYISSAYWGAGIGGDGTVDSWTAPRNGSIGYDSSLQDVIDQGMRGQWGVYDYDTNTTQLDYDGVSLGTISGTAASITYPTNSGMTLFSDTNGSESTSNTCFETMVLFPNTETARTSMAQSLMSQDAISLPSAPATSDGFTMTGEYLPSYSAAPADALGSGSVGPDAHGMTWNPQSGGYAWPSIAYANNITNGATMWRFIDEQGDSDTNVTGAERTEIAAATDLMKPGSSFSFFYQFNFEQLQQQTGSWCVSGQIHYNNALAGATAPDTVFFSCANNQIQFGTQKMTNGSEVTTDCGAPIPLTPGTTYAVAGTGFWSTNGTSDTLKINAGVNGSPLPLICNVGPTSLWNNDTGAYLKQGIYRGYPFGNAGTAILRVMNPQMTTTANAFSSYVTTQPALPLHSGSVATPAPTCSISASPASITSGKSSTLSWSSANATSATLNGSSVLTNGSQGVSPTTSTTYTLNVSGNGGSGSCNTTVAVSAATTSDTSAPSVPVGLSASALSSSAISLTWSASADNVGVTGYDIYRNGTKIGTSATNSYSDTGLAASTAYSYAIDAYDAAGNTSAQSSSVSATTQAASVVAGKFTIGEQIATIGYANVRSSAAGTVLGTQKPGAVGTVIAGPTPAALSGTTYTWWNLNFASGVDGWVADNNLQAYAPVVSMPAPTASLSASPASITSGQPTTLTWSSTNATSCTGTNFTASGTSGSVSVSPNQTTTYSLTCSGPGGTSSVSAAMVTVTVGGTTSTGSGSGGSATLAIDGHSSSNGANVQLTTKQANDVVVVQVTNESESKTAISAITGISDSLGLAWHQLAATSSTKIVGWNGPIGTDTEVWWAVAPKALAADKITPHFSGRVDCVSYVAYGVSGADTTNPWDSNTSLPAMAINVSSNGLTPSVSGVSTDAGNTLLFGFMGTSEDGSNNSNGAYAAGSGFTMIGQNVDPDCSYASAEAVEYQALSSPQSGVSVSLGGSVQGGWFMMAHAMRAASLSTASQTSQVASAATVSAVLAQLVQELQALLAQIAQSK